jgi:excinuclease ABC subunit A
MPTASPSGNAPSPAADSRMDGDRPEHIRIRGARVHNLRNVDVDLPLRKLTVVTGLSGSGKSSLAFDTLYAEGQRRYVESLSAYVRQFAGRLEKPDVDRIDNLTPAIAVEQRVASRSSRSTVGTVTEVHDHLKLLWARLGRTFSPVSGGEVRKDTVTDVVNAASSQPAGGRFMVCAPVSVPEDRTLAAQLEVWQQQGFARLLADGEATTIEDQLTAIRAQEEAGTKPVEVTLHLVIDRLAVPEEDDPEEFMHRLADSVDTAFYEGHGVCELHWVESDGIRIDSFSDRYELDGMAFELPAPDLFSFNSPQGACPRCEGFGHVIGISEDLVIPDPSKSVYENAVAPWRGEKASRYKQRVLQNAYDEDFPVHTPYADLTAKQKRQLWQGTRSWKGIDDFFSRLEAKSYKIQNRVMLSRYRGRTACDHCGGSRLRPEAGYVQIDGRKLPDLLGLPIEEVLQVLDGLQLSETEQEIGQRLLLEIRHRLQFLLDVGLGYLTLNRGSATLSGGESQRIQLGTSLGSSLVGSTYVLDEPSIGLHPHDTDRLIRVLSGLRDLGNTVVVVEHEESVIRAADHVVDLGPQAGSEGGQIMFSGALDALLSAPDSLTADYLNGSRRIPVPENRRPGIGTLSVCNAKEHNLQGVDADFLLGALNVVTGVSGSGKSTLVKRILHPLLTRHLDLGGDRPGVSDGLSGDLDRIEMVEFVDQNPIGKSSRSNPATYVKAWDDVRSLFAAQPLSRNRGYKPSVFSFNTSGGRCETCEGEGRVSIGMQFMADVTLTCDACKGKRFTDPVLEIEVDGRNIHDVLSMTVAEASAFFGDRPKPTAAERGIVRKLAPLLEVGLGYVTLGQSATTLSGGEAQRIKLGAFLAKGDRTGHTVFIFDEPTTGLHFHDVAQLLEAFDALIRQGHTVICVEHNLDVMACADHIVDLGPGGGTHGGQCVAMGTPEKVAQSVQSVTASFLRDRLHP